MRISKRTVDALLPPTVGRIVAWDTELKGFGVRVHESGRKVYVAKYRVGARQRWYTIGEHGGAWTPELARERAREVLRAAERGLDLQEQKAARRRDLTVSELIDLYLLEGPASKPDKRASTWATDRSNLDRHLRRCLGSRIARQVSTADITRMVQNIAEMAEPLVIKTKPRGKAVVRGGAGTAERVLSTTGAMFAWAKAQDLVDSIPTQGIRLPRRRARERFLSAGEVAHLLATLDRLTSERTVPETHADAIRLLIHTGARKREICELRWSEVQVDRQIVLLPPERTKAGGSNGDRRINLGKAGVDLVQRRPKISAYVFPSTVDPEKPLVGLQKSWDRVRRASGFEGLRIHDLRHTFASLALAKGASLPLVGKALGHANLRVTERYAHLTETAVRELVEVVSGVITGDAA